LRISNCELHWESIELAIPKFAIRNSDPWRIWNRKELVARAIHERSKRKHRSLVKVNCASIPRELFESEFFGHVKGAFTDALRDRAGRFEVTDGVT
jgi:sigma54-dependent transcription regulator